jgi:hypothetical protein
MKRATLLCILAGAGIAGCSIIKAQPTQVAKTGTLVGVITGPGGPVANAAITVTAVDATQHVGVSNAAGYYAISGIPEGPATFSVRVGGYTQYDGSVVIASEPTRNEQNISLNPQ